jgi:RNA polymerase sigma factor (sigma-70 family)
MRPPKDAGARLGKLVCGIPSKTLAGREAGTGSSVSKNVTLDADLFASWSAGSRDAGNELIERHFELVHRFFRNKVGAELEDLVQRTFLACVEARDRYRGQASFKTYLLSIARHQLFSHYRRQHQQALDFTITSVHDLATSPSGVLARTQDGRLLAEAFRRVPLEAQVVLELAYWEELDGTEIASVLEVSLNTAYSRLHRARIAVRECLRVIAPDRPSLMSWFYEPAERVD